MDKKLSKLDTAKLGVEFLMTAGSDRIINSVISAHVPRGNRFQNVAVFSARLGLGMAISQATANVVNRYIDDLAEGVKKAREEIAAQKAENDSL